MKRFRDIAGLLFTIYVVAYMSVIVPMHVAAFDCGHGDGVVTQSLEHSHKHQSPDQDDGHDQHRCQICLSGGLHQVLPSASFVITIDINSFELICNGAISEHGVTLSHCRLSRAPPAFA